MSKIDRCQFRNRTYEIVSEKPVPFEQVASVKHRYFMTNHDLYYKFKPHKKKPKFYQIVFDSRNFCYLVYSGEYFVDAFSSFSHLISCPYLKLDTKHMYFIQRKQCKVNNNVRM